MRVVGDDSVTLRRPARARMTRQFDAQVAARSKLLEMVACDVRMEVEALGHLGGFDTVGRRPHEEVDIAAGRISERTGDGDNRGGELVRTQIRLRHVAILPTQVVEIPWRPC